ncbi:hypothetical protein [Actinoplanes derwentensis]|uniref:Uncharacterized protein n=1 Tax=Actinoplanes derwentensis TaxID=113562 RepID=A0A1H2BJH5_9ACTN|nr:hypothetical protein [Actinoplanes derwentensis]SDT58415.1 hypothetical protein SAMN04489716_4670 [Actinoplanes derwentensis]
MKVPGRKPGPAVDNRELIIVIVVVRDEVMIPSAARGIVRQAYSDRRLI